MGASKMKEPDCAEVVVEKEKYIRDGVHRGMKGWICDNRCIQGYWLVIFLNMVGRKILQRFR